MHDRPRRVQGVVGACSAAGLYGCRKRCHGVERPGLGVRARRQHGHSAAQGVQGGARQRERRGRPCRDERRAALALRAVLRTEVRDRHRHASEVQSPAGQVTALRRGRLAPANASGVELLAVDPEPERRVRYEVYLLAVDGVVAVLQLRGVVLGRHLVVVGRLEPDALDFLARDVLHAVGDREASVGRAVYEVRRRAHVGPQVVRVVALEDLERVQAAAVAVLADEPVDRLVFAELVDAGREDDELAAVGHGHARAVDGLVAEPCGRELGGVEVDDALPDAVLHVVDVLLLRELYRLSEAVSPLADEDAV